jgi:hypothetical protein
MNLLKRGGLSFDGTAEGFSQSHTHAVVLEDAMDMATGLPLRNVAFAGRVGSFPTEHQYSFTLITSIRKLL